MKFVLWIFALLCAGLPIAQTLKCNKCLSGEGWDECMEEEVTCYSGFDRCGKQEIQIKSEGLSVKSFVKGCTTKAQCDNSKELVLKLCEQNKKAGADATCELNCCSGDLCNAGTAPVVSAVLILACAVLALFQ